MSNHGDFKEHLPRVNKKDCILWTGAGSDPTTNRTQNCGMIRRYDKHRGKVISKTPARYYYEEANGPLRKGMEVYHLCGVSLCYNLKHLIAGTRSALYKLMVEEGRRYRPPAKSHCPHGHKLEGENLYLWTNKAGITRRLCRTCRNTKARESLRAKKGWKPRKKRDTPDMSDPKTLCGKGLHAFTKENTMVYWNATDKRWNRLCRKCANKRLRVRWRQKKGKGTMINKYREEWMESYGIS